MKIVVNDIAASEGGALGILLEFYEAIKKWDKVNEYIFLLSSQYFEDSDRIKTILLPKIKNNHLKKIFFDFVTGRFLIRDLKPDIVLSMQNIITFGVKLPQVVYVHQPLPYQKVKSYSFFRKQERSLAFIQKVIGKIINLSIKHSDGVIVQTEWMKAAIIEKTKIDQRKIYVVKPDIKFPKFEKDNSDFNRTKFFYPTSTVLYKNNELISKACAILEKNKSLDISVELTIPEKNGHKDSNQIYYIGKISRKQVFEKYKTMTLIFPSYIESFGMPLAEAAGMNAIILAADCEYAHEVLSDYKNAYFFDYKNAESLATLIEKVAEGKITKQICKREISENCSWIYIINFILGTFINY